MCGALSRRWVHVTNVGSAENIVTWARVHLGTFAVLQQQIYVCFGDKEGRSGGLREG